MTHILEATGRFLRRYWLIPAFLLAIVMLAATTDILERFFVYYPASKVEGDPSLLGMPFEDIYLKTQDGLRLHGWLVSKPDAVHTFLIFHGNAGNIGHRLDWIRMLYDLNANILIIDYRGFGNSEGRPCEKGLYLDARAAHDWVRRQRPKERDTLVLLGESLGGAVAVELASVVPVKALILQSAFTSAWDMAKTIMPLGLLRPLAGISFDSQSKIKRIHCPKPIIHGSRDEIVPLRLGKKLFSAAAPPKEFYEVPGAGHNDLLAIAGDDYVRRIRAFLDSLPR